MERGRRTSWTGRPRPQHVSAQGASEILRVTSRVVSPTSASASDVGISSIMSSSGTLNRRRLRDSFRPFLTGSGSQTEFDVTHSKQRAGKFLTGARTAIRIFGIPPISAQNDDATNIVIPSEAVVGPTRALLCFSFAKFCAFLPGSRQKVECDVTYSKQSTDAFLPGATTASKAHGRSSNFHSKLSEGRAWLRQ